MKDTVYMLQSSRNANSLLQMLFKKYKIWNAKSGMLLKCEVHIFNMYINILKRIWFESHRGNYKI